MAIKKKKQKFPTKTIIGLQFEKSVKGQWLHKDSERNLFIIAQKMGDQVSAAVGMRITSNNAPIVDIVVEHTDADYESAVTQGLLKFFKATTFVIETMEETLDHVGDILGVPVEGEESGESETTSEEDAAD